MKAVMCTGVCMVCLEILSDSSKGWSSVIGITSPNLPEVVRCP